MLDIIFVLLFFCLNFIIFFLFNLTSIVISKKKLLIVLAPILVAVVVLVMMDSEKYIGAFYTSVALFGLASLRFIGRKYSKDDVDKTARFILRIFDSVLFPFFFLFASFVQCMSVLVWNS